MKRRRGHGGKKKDPHPIPALLKITKRRKKGMDANSLWVAPQFQSKQASNFTAVEDLVFCKAYAAVLEDSTVGTDQNEENFLGKIFESFGCLSLTESANRTF